MVVKMKKNFDPEIYKISDPLSHSEQLELFYRYKNHGDQEAYKKLICSNIRLAYKIADSYGCEKLRDDLRSEAILALIFALEHWDPSRGLFTTIATPIINQRLRRYLVENMHVVKIPYLAFKDYIVKNRKKSGIEGIINSRYLSNRDLTENGQLAIADKSGEDITEHFEINTIYGKLKNVDEEYRILFELVYNLSDYYDRKISLEQLSRSLRISRSKLKTRLKCVEEYLFNPRKCVKCQKEFFRTNKRSTICDSCIKAC